MIAPHLRHPDKAHDPAVWNTNDGRAIPIAELDDDHLVNICHWLRRRIIPLFREHLSRLYSAANPEMMGEMARDALEQEEEVFWERYYNNAEPTPEEYKQAASWHPQVKLLVAEVKARGLDHLFGEDSFLTDLEPTP
jgi:hypothetical protein